MPPRKRSSAAKPRTISQKVASSPGCVPLRSTYLAAEKLNPKNWGDVEALFLRGMEAFDDNVVSGVAELGDLQNGKGDFFNDLLSLILENCAQIQLYSRGGVPGLTFPKHNLDVTYPSVGTIEFILEAKAVGTPKHPRSPRAKDYGRPGSADLDKRVKEIGFKTIDLKAEYARILTGTGESPTTISGDLTSWLRSVRPRSYVFLAARVISDADRDRVFQFARVANLVSDAVGVFCFRPVNNTQLTRYKSEKVPSDIELGRVLFRACQDLISIKGKRVLKPDTPSPSEDAESIPLPETLKSD
jgi:hypothetical protein